jgi:hypothetical protein
MKNTRCRKGADGCRVDRKGVEPSTSALRTHENTDASITGKELATSDSPACSNACSNLDDLARIVAAWPSLPAPIRRAMLALIG